jgi:RNA-directed DNA polymerase
VILTNRNPKEAERLLRETLGRLDLKPHPEKTRVLNAKAGHFDFLGFNFRQRKNSRTGKWFCLLQPSQKAQRNLREKIRQATAPQELEGLGEVVRQKVNPILRGWVNYFRIGNSSRVFNKIREFVLGRILRFIRRRQKRSGMGWNRISGDFLYGTLGLVYEYRLSWTSRKAMV